MTPEERQQALVNSALNFVSSLASVNLSDRDAIKTGMGAALALYTATDDYTAFLTMFNRLRNWHDLVTAAKDAPK